MCKHVRRGLAEPVNRLGQCKICYNADRKAKAGIRVRLVSERFRQGSIVLFLPGLTRNLDLSPHNLIEAVLINVETCLLESSSSRLMLWFRIIEDGIISPLLPGARFKTNTRGATAVFFVSSFVSPYPQGFRPIPLNPTTKYLDAR